MAVACGASTGALNALAFDGNVATSALYGGLIGGFTGWILGLQRLESNNNLDFDILDENGNKTISKEYIEYAKNYDPKQNDLYLKARFEDRWGVIEGDYNITDITTASHDPEIIGMTKTGSRFVRMSDGTRLGGYLHRLPDFTSNLHIAPGIALTNDNVLFDAVSGHEFIHGYHYYKMGKYYNSRLSEHVAYNFSYDTFFQAGRFSEAFSILNTSILNNYYGAYSFDYKLPTGIWW